MEKEVDNVGLEFKKVKRPSLIVRFFKRAFDIFSSGIVILILIPFFIVFTPIVAIAMKGNPFFTQVRAGLNGKTFKLIKYRTMTNAKDDDGNLLPDEVRLTKFGKIMRATSIDELPELLNILFGKMSVVGPRPLLVTYLPYYTEYENQRHLVRPGLTGLAQVKGRNFITWEEIFEYDVEYVGKCNLFRDLSIIFQTVLKVLKRGDIADVNTITVDSEGNTWVIDNGVKKRLHRPLNEEREKND